MVDWVIYRGVVEVNQRVGSQIGYTFDILAPNKKTFPSQWIFLQLFAEEHVEHVSAWSNSAFIISKAYTLPQGFAIHRDYSGLFLNYYLLTCGILFAKPFPFLPINTSLPNIIRERNTLWTVFEFIWCYSIICICLKCFDHCDLPYDVLWQSTWTDLKIYI